VLPRQLLFLPYDLLPDAYLAGCHLLGIPGKQRVLIDHGHREGLLDMTCEDSGRVSLMKFKGQGSQLREGDTRGGPLEGSQVVQSADLGEEGGARAYKEGC
jgi:hypothetical protein